MHHSIVCPDGYMFPSGAIQSFLGRGAYKWPSASPKAERQHLDQWSEFHHALSTPEVESLGGIDLDFYMLLVPAPQPRKLV